MRHLLKSQNQVITSVIEESISFIVPLRAFRLMRLDRPLKSPMGYYGNNAGNWYYAGDL